MSSQVPIEPVLAVLLATVRIVGLARRRTAVHHAAPSPTLVKVAVAVGARAAGRSAAGRPGPGAGDRSRCSWRALFQVVIGAALGFLTYLLFSAVQAAGELIDLFGGFSLGHAVRPAVATSAARVFGRFYQMIAVDPAVRHRTATCSCCAASWRRTRCSPCTPTSIGRAHPDGHRRTSGTFFASALQIAAPLVAVLFLADARAGPAHPGGARAQRVRAELPGQDPAHPAPRRPSRSACCPER